MDHNKMESTASMLLDYLGSDSNLGWVYFADLDEWELFFNPMKKPRFIGPLARNLIEVGFAETRRASNGMQIRLTDRGRNVWHERDEHSKSVYAMVDQEAFATMLAGIGDDVDN